MRLGQAGGGEQLRALLRRARAGAEAADHHRAVQRAGGGRADSHRRAQERDPSAIRTEVLDAACGCSARRRRRQYLEKQTQEQVTSESPYESRNRPGIVRGGQVARLAAVCAVMAAGPGFAEGFSRCDRRRALVCFVNTVVALIGGGLAAVLGAFALRPATRGRGPLGPRRRARRPHAQRAGAARAVGLAPGRLVSRARARNRVPRLGRRQDGPRAVGHLHPPRLPGALGRARHAASAARATAASSTRTGNVVEGPPPRPLDRVEARIDTREASCWCGCEAAVRLAAGADRLSRRARTCCSTSRCRPAPAGSSRSAACCSRCSASSSSPARS